jgi:hypothetical protein
MGRFVAYTLTDISLLKLLSNAGARGLHFGGRYLLLHRSIYTYTHIYVNYLALLRISECVSRSPQNVCDRHLNVICYGGLESASLC